MIKISKLSKHFGNLKVLDKINLSISQGEVVALVGPSGCGKSTLLHCVTGLDENYKGNIHLNNLEINEYLKVDRIAIVLQKYSNFHWLTVKKNIEASFINVNISEKDRNEKITSLLSDLNLVDFSNSYMNELSGGMQQRVAVARAIAQNTEIIALDEPFGSLDINNRLTLQLLLKKLNIKFRKTSLFVTHDIEEAIFLSDKVVVLSKIPSTVLVEYTSDFKDDIDPNVKYSSDFIKLKKEIEKHFLS